MSEALINVNPWVCSVCKNGYNSKYRLLMHQQVHYGSLQQNPPTLPAPLPSPPKVTPDTPDIQEKRQELELMRLDIEKAKLERERQLLGQPIAPATNPLNEAFTLISKMDEMIARRMSQQIAAPAADTDYTDTLALKALEAYIASQKNTPAVAISAESNKRQGATQTAPALTEKEVQEKMSNLIPNNGAPMPSAAEFEEYKRAIKSGELSEEDAWLEVGEIYPHLVKYITREKFTEEYNKLKNS